MKPTPVLGRALVVLVSIAGCARSSTSVDGAAEERGAASHPEPPPCQPDPPREDSSFRIDTGTCPWIVRRASDGQRLTFLHLGPGERTYRATLPEPCRRASASSCEFTGFDSPWGPLVWLHKASPESEMPAGSWLGFPVERDFVFVDAWEGEPDDVWSDGTPLGPAYGLAPFDCGGRLALLAVPRLNAADEAEVSPGLRAREGFYDVALAEDETPPAVEERSRCSRVGPPPS